MTFQKYGDDNFAVLAENDIGIDAGQFVECLLQSATQEVVKTLLRTPHNNSRPVEPMFDLQFIR